VTARKGSPCPVAGCEAHAKPGQLMCWPHWRRVPKALNRAVFDTFAEWERDPRHDTHRSYRQARDAAIAAVNEKKADERERGEWR